MGFQNHHQLNCQTYLQWFMSLVILLTFHRHTHNPATSIHVNAFTNSKSWQSHIESKDNGSNLSSNVASLTLLYWSTLMLLQIARVYKQHIESKNNVSNFSSNVAWSIRCIRQKVNLFFPTKSKKLKNGCKMIIRWRFQRADRGNERN